MRAKVEEKRRAREFQQPLTWVHDVNTLGVSDNQSKLLSDMELLTL